jgi:hypothetical protein
MKAHIWMLALFGLSCGGNDGCDEKLKAMARCQRYGDLSGDLGRSKSGNCQAAWLQVCQSICPKHVYVCGSAEQQGLDEYVSCLQDLPVCKAGEESAWNKLQQQCTEKLAKISPGCKTQFFASCPTP